jgi:hypothetical protein
LAFLALASPTPTSIVAIHELKPVTLVFQSLLSPGSVITESMSPSAHRIVSPERLLYVLIS